MYVKAYMADNDITGSPVRLAKVVTGIPSAPKATGVVSNISTHESAINGSILKSNNICSLQWFVWTNDM